MKYSNENAADKRNSKREECKAGKTELIRSIQRAEGNDMEKRVKGHQKKERK
jgi:hypothetical protein